MSFIDQDLDSKTLHVESRLINSFENEYIFKWRSIFSFLKIRFKYLLSSLSLSFFPTDSSRSYALQNELIEIELQQKLNKGLFFTDDIWIPNDFRNKDIAEGEL